ncbi:FAD binding domain-containing protein [Lasiosphaeria miniovina]|uniref:FAD binding domain-containing protein n=1 Tax=Lasiosphaeria miniovina TaxID=1954250 RepID=A0AA40BEV4_9PEZI|nr:FAD binding domain-containing protein [Lasiosphaeria miniovina]KAK0732911.1 FAD binding domain-containing protein [Lasiosphaeria miniovina]
MDDKDVIKTDLLIVGAGPAGASLACFLAAQGITGIIIAAAAGTAETPRAHITNRAGLECLRDIGLEQECLDVAGPSHHMEHTRWCRTMAGEEFARVYSWGHDPKHKGDYESASPCSHVDLPQTLLEPILVKRAVHCGWTLRFKTRFVGMTRPAPDVIISEVYDEVFNKTYRIQSRFVFGCDGARSQVVRELGIPLARKPGQGLALNVLVKADMSHLVTNRTGNLHWVVSPEEVDGPPWAWAALVRMVRPWTEWMFIFLPAPGADLKADAMDATESEYVARVKKVIGDDSVEVDILDVSKWWINEIVAEYYSDGNVFCLGDATHRHPPFNGLGSNTCIQDAFNLAWKIDHVMAGKAGTQLLDSFSRERQPVGVEVITRANQGLRDHVPWQRALGMLEPDAKTRHQILAEFDEPGENGQARRRGFQRAIENTSTEFHGLGIEMNQRYFSNAVFQADQGAPPPPPEDAVRTYQMTTFPGRRLPHAWLNTRSPGKRLSIIDLAGHGQFCLLTGPGGHGWKDAAAVVSESLGAEIKSYAVGWHQDYEDVYFDWARRREVDEDGCVLVRPDRFVAWRSKAMVPDPVSRLEAVMKSVLSL